MTIVRSKLGAQKKKAMMASRLRWPFNTETFLKNSSVLGEITPKSKYSLYSN